MLIQFTISIAIIPKDQTSTFGPYCFLVTTSYNFIVIKEEKKEMFDKQKNIEQNERRNLLFIYRCHPIGCADHRCSF